MSHTVGVNLTSPPEPLSEKQGQPSRSLCLLYHELRSSESRYSYAIDAALFQQHVDLYVQLRQAENAALWPEITFDDGHISNFELAAPILQSRNISAKFFITVGWTGTKPAYMGWAELQSLYQAGHTIGAHGMTHKLLTHCTERELHAELRDARLMLEEKLSIPITTMSLPGGRYNRRILTACEEAGYNQIYTSIPKAAPIPSALTIGRLNILGNVQPEWIARVFELDSKLLEKIGKQYRQKEMVKKLLGDKLYAKLWAHVNRQEQPTDNGEDIAG